MHVFRLTENKSIDLVLPNVRSKKKCFFQEATIAACLKFLSFNRYFDRKRKKCYIVSSFFYLKGGKLEAASLACSGVQSGHASHAMHDQRTFLNTKKDYI